MAVGGSKRKKKKYIEIRGTKCEIVLIRDKIGKRNEK